jgi:hypothetical protein
VQVPEPFKVVHHLLCREQAMAMHLVQVQAVQALQIHRVAQAEYMVMLVDHIPVPLKVINLPLVVAVVAQVQPAGTELQIVQVVQVVLEQCQL